jgi:hypothetical protein
MIFLHKDEFMQQYRSKWLPKYDFPVILSESNNGLEIFMTSEEIAKFEKVEDLILKIQERVKTFE